MSRFLGTDTCRACWRRAGWAWSQRRDACWRYPRDRSACWAMNARRGWCRCGIGRLHNERVRESPAWLWPNLLSLDAPVVAVLWQILFARCFQVPPDALAAILLLLTVWLIYAADRTLDAWKGECHSPRHEFYRRRWRDLLPV